MAAIYSFESSAQAAFSATTNCRNPVGVDPFFPSFPQGSWMPQSRWDWVNYRHVNPAAGISKDAGSVSPSPWGEGRDEGGLRSNLPPLIISTRSRQSAIGNQQSAMFS
jgi:hypothetical protein